MFIRPFKGQSQALFHLNAHCLCVWHACPFLNFAWNMFPIHFSLGPHNDPHIFFMKPISSLFFQIFKFQSLRNFNKFSKYLKFSIQSLLIGQWLTLHLSLPRTINCFVWCCGKGIVTLAIFYRDNLYLSNFTFKFI